MEQDVHRQPFASQAGRIILLYKKYIRFNLW